MPKPNRFASLMEARQVEPAVSMEETGPASPRVDHEIGIVARDVPRPPAAHSQTTVPRDSVRGRPRVGKRSNPDYKQISALIRKDTHLNVTRALLDDPDQDVSDLLQELLEGWLKHR